MPDAFTANLALVKPEVGASRDTWGAKTNANWDALDQFVGMATPIGAILDFAGPNAPPGWLICDGRLVSRTTFSALFAVIGTYWGAGDGSTTFALPNVRGRSTVGPGAITDSGGMSWVGLSFAQSFGFVWQNISQAMLPNFQLYCANAGYHAHTGPTTPAGGHSHVTDAQGSHSHSGGTSYETADHSHAGTTDTQGDHTHSVNAWSSTGGGGGLALGSLATQGNVTTSVAGAHAHNFGTGGVSNPHYHIINTDGLHAHNVAAVGDHQHYIQWDGDHNHAVWLNGGGTAMTMLSPIVCITKIIYAGEQASARAMTAAVPTSVVLEGVDELVALRQEMAELRAQLEAVFVPPRQRLLSAPLRGPH